MTESGLKLKRFRLRFRFEHAERNEERLLKFTQLGELEFDRALQTALKIGEKYDAGKLTEIKILFKGG